MPLSEKEIGEAREIFAVIDRNGDDKISTGELGLFLRATRRAPSDAEVAQYASSLDPKNTGLISFADLLPFLANTPAINPQQAEQDLVAAFRVFDGDRTGFIASNELKHIVMSVGDKMSERDADALIKEADPNGTGRIDYQAFSKRLIE
jgi:Ca2+-binding EF-hand superfamily protein